MKATFWFLTMTIAAGSVLALAAACGDDSSSSSAQGFGGKAGSTAGGAGGSSGGSGTGGSAGGQAGTGAGGKAGSAGLGGSSAGGSSAGGSSAGGSSTGGSSAGGSSAGGASGTGCSTWTTEFVNTPGDGGEFSSIQIDGSGRPHIGYGNRAQVRYALKDSSWTIELLENAGQMLSISLALDSGGTPHVAYPNYLTGAYRYASRGGSSWTIETIADAEVLDASTGIGLALDSADHAHAAYFDFTAGDTRYATNASGTWAAQTIEHLGLFTTPGAATDEWVGLALDAGGHAHVSYLDWHNGYSARYATNLSGAWVKETSAPSTGWTPVPIALAASGEAYVAYSFLQPLKLATNASGAWVVQTLDQGQIGSPSIAVDGAGKYHIAYGTVGSGQNMEVKYGTNVSGNWTVVTVDSYTGIGAGTANPSLALDGNGRPHLSSWDPNDPSASLKGGLKYATCN